MIIRWCKNHAPVPARGKAGVAVGEVKDNPLLGIEEKKEENERQQESRSHKSIRPRISSLILANDGTHGSSTTLRPRPSFRP